MFAYLRIFIIVSLISVVIIAAMVGVYLGSVGKQDMVLLNESKNALMIKSYEEAVWKHSPFPSYSIRTRGAEFQQKKQMFEANSNRYMQSLTPYFFAIYDAAGQAVYTYNGEASHIKIVSKIIAELKQKETKPVSVIVSRETESGTLTVLRTFLPLSISNNKYYVEIQNDITEVSNKLMVQQWIASGSIILVFLLLMFILIQTSKKAEQIIARQHESNMELARKAAVAEAENEQKSMFLANISHELRTPLNAIIGFSDLMKTQLISEEDQQRYGNYINDINNAGVHLLSLINDILDYSKAEAGKMEVDMEAMNFSKLVKTCLRLVETRATEAGVKLVDATPKDTLQLTTDSKKLKQILLNLLSNAVKFTPSGGQVTVSAWRNVQDNSIGFEVKDSGIGMKPKDISRAMSPFGQVDSSLARKYEGTGLGLPLTKKFVEIMGGEFKIESEEGKGTTITITLPVEPKVKRA